MSKPHVFEVTSSHGHFRVRPDGGVAAYIPAEEGTEANHQRRIVKFDLVEWYRYWQSQGKQYDTPPVSLDILDLGYWYRKNGQQQYEPPEMSWRKEFGDVAHGRRIPLNSAG